MTRFSRLLVLCALLALALTAYAQADDLQITDFDIAPDFFAEVEVSIDDDDVSMLFVVTTTDAEDSVALVEIYDPETDEFLYSIEEEENIITFGFEPFADYTGELGLYLPASAASQLEAGDYTFVFEAVESEIESVRVIVRSSANVNAMQAMDINIWVFPEILQDPTEQTDFEAALRSTYDAVLSAHHMQLGVVNFFTADADDYAQYASPQITEEDTTSLNDLCEAMAAQVGAGRALNLAVIENFEEPGTAEGETTGIAISAGNAGTLFDATSRNSCVIVAHAGYSNDYANQAVNILHETAHFISIPHTTESGGDIFDIFTDTPECPAEEYDIDGDEIVFEDECDIAGGANNLMFWSGDGYYAPFIISEEQAFVMRRHPLFYSVND